MDAPIPKSQRVLRVLLKVTAWTVGTLVVLVALLYMINAFDEDLSPEAKALLVVPPNPYKSDENLNMALLGLDAPAGASPIPAAEERLAARGNALAALAKDPKLKWPDALEQKRLRLEFQGKADFCQPLTASCLGRVTEHKAEIEALQKANWELMRRYSLLHGRKGYYDGSADLLFLPAFAPRGARQLYLAGIALQAKAGNRSQQQVALANLHDDIRTWRQMLVGEGSLIAKMIAVANLQGDFLLLADIVSDRRFDLSVHSAGVRAALDAMRDRDWMIGDFQGYEFRVAVNMLERWTARGEMNWVGMEYEDIPAWEQVLSRIVSPFFKIRATENLLADAGVRRKVVDNTEPAQLPAAQSVYRAWHESKGEIGLHSVYNPLGKSMFAAVGPDTYFNYSLRTYDCAALFRLLRLGYEIRIRRIGDKGLPAFMREHPEWSTHPVDGKPFLWDDKKREIRVQTLGSQPKDRRFYISVWRP